MTYKNSEIKKTNEMLKLKAKIQVLRQHYREASESDRELIVRRGKLLKKDLVAIEDAQLEKDAREAFL